ncbi:TIGR02450 family Trp-rich protein [Zwartia vadi]|uniref:TIGR02450 family Trp-rich protein n=1 Tax=Zwartia vadi TaxID=3058168 RepID=UPI0025B62829|nr:TIGR02450 family Trp-rich protein [Zwartia vadi]
MKSESVAAKNHVHPKKLLLSKWTAVKPTHKEKHFWVTKVIQPEQLDEPVVEVILEAAMTGRQIKITWRDLKHQENWRQGWV